MITGLILSGGAGIRLGGDLPKQYIKVQGKPILIHCLEKFERWERLDSILVVAARKWQENIQRWASEYGIQKFCGCADAGISRQHSIWNGLRKMKEMGAGKNDIVIVHDAVRPCVQADSLEACIAALDKADGALPVLPVKDTVYQSSDGKEINNLLNRDELYAGQAPESFRFGLYYEAHKMLESEKMRQIRGSSEIAYRSGMRVKLIPGDEGNYKITTLTDLQKFQRQMEQKMGGEA